MTELAYDRNGKSIIGPLTLDVPVSRLGVLGRNGSGKSTFARILSGLVAPTHGEVLLNGCAPAKDRKAALREVGILFQNPDHQIIFPTVIEEIVFGLGQLGVDAEQAKNVARQVLGRFGKAHWADVNVTTLSQGQKHLVCLMAVAAMAPRLLILDEPFAGLDIPTKMQLNMYLSRYSGNLVHITHDPRDLDGYAQVLWLDAGNVRMIGEADDVIRAYLAEMQRLGTQDDLADLTR